MAEHRLAAFARLVLDEGGRGMELRERPFGRGLEVRVWLPDGTGREALALARRSGWDVTNVARSMPYADSDHYDGVQLVVTIPLAEANELADMLVPALIAVLRWPRPRFQRCPPPSTG